VVKVNIGEGNTKKTEPKKYFCVFSPGHPQGFGKGVEGGLHACCIARRASGTSMGERVGRKEHLSIERIDGIT
jgi:hypothetical protein